VVFNDIAIEDCTRSRTAIRGFTQLIKINAFHFFPLVVGVQNLRNFYVLLPYFWGGFGESDRNPKSTLKAV